MLSFTTRTSRSPCFLSNLLELVFETARRILCAWLLVSQYLCVVCFHCNRYAFPLFPGRVRASILFPLIVRQIAQSKNNAVMSLNHQKCQTSICVHHRIATRSVRHRRSLN